MKDANTDSDAITRLATLKAEHRDLDYAIATIGEQSHYDQVQIQRLKKRKLKLKDLIDRLEDGERPDIIA